MASRLDRIGKAQGVIERAGAAAVGFVTGVMEGPRRGGGRGGGDGCHGRSQGRYGGGGRRMTLNLPERVASLHELTDDDHRALYLPEQDGDGYRLSRPRLAAFEDYLETAATLVAEHATAMAEREAQHQRRAALLPR